MDPKNIISADDLPSFCWKKLIISSAKSKNYRKDALNPRQQSLVEAVGNNSKADGSPIEQLQCTINNNSISMKKKLKQNCNQKMHAKEKGDNSKEKRDKSIIAVTLNVSFVSIVSLIDIS